MAGSVLGSLALSYRLLWDQRRRVAGAQLWIDTPQGQRVDAAALVSALVAFDFRPTVPLLLNAPAMPLLADLLTQTPPAGCWITVPEFALQDPAILRRTKEAWQRGVRLVWQGGPGSRPPAGLAPCFTRNMLTLSPQESLSCLRTSLRQPLGGRSRGLPESVSPVQPGQIYEDVPSGLLADHCLDEGQTWALSGWPLEEVLHGARQARSQPARSVILQLLDALEADGFTEPLEPWLEDDPVLAYRLLRFANSAALGLRTPIESLRDALQVIGRVQLRAWLQDQLSQASTQPNLQAVRGTMALRARLMVAMLDGAASDELRSEVLLCGLLSQIDLLLGEPLHDVLGRLPLPARITETLLGQAGPYLPLIEMAIALEHPGMQDAPDLCKALGLQPETVNQALLHTLSHMH